MTIIIGLGANLPSRFGTPVQTLEQALAALEVEGDQLLARSRWYESAPVPMSSQPWYINGVASIVTRKSPEDLLRRLHDIEADFGRVRAEVNAPRIVDLDLLDYDGIISSSWPILPHPRLQERKFVLQPLAEIVPEWRHPIIGKTAGGLLADTDLQQITRIVKI